jgi:ABC-type antimicrobial peptide transport system permease subunit
LYAVLAFAVAQRTREIGVRRALGADSTRVVRMVARQGARQVGIGIALGLIGAIGFAFALSSLLAGVWIGDPITYLAVALTFALVAMLATVLPVRQALRIEPIQALRYD